ncbi:E3 ubiquitin-protein ligase UPL1 [Trifolium repens]|nr:E3 ubiquitin-protein ligase UPL1 [Trifolium repens]
MTTLRSNWPSRLRQLLSSEGAIGPSIKLDSEPPPKVKSFIEKVIQCPLQDIAIPLSGFRWEYDKGNFHHWRPLLLHFNTYFKTFLSCRNDLTLLDNLEDDSPLPKHAILQILRVMQIILENCPNKSTFDGIEHFKLLLASTDPEILIAALETLSALVKINPSKLHGQTYGGSEAVTDDMEHDQDLDGNFPPTNEDDYMHDNSEDARDAENGMESVGLQFEIQPHGQENLDEDDDEDDEMSGDEGEDVDEDEEDDEEHNDLEHEVHHLPHPDTDQDDHEIDDDDFDDEVMEEDDEEDEEDEDGVILRLEEGINGINVLDHIEVLGRDNNFPNEAFHVMPVEVFGSRRPGRTTSIYNLLGRTGDTAIPSRHPLLVDPSSSFSSSMGQSDSFLENNSSGLDNIFRSLRSGRHGNRLNLWTDNNPQSGGSNTSVVPPGLEELLVSQLRQRTPENSPNQGAAEAGSHGNVEPSQAQDSGGARPEIPVESNAIQGVSTMTPSIIDNSNDADNRPAGTGEQTNVSNVHSQDAEIQFEHNDGGAARDVEAVSQESSGSGATFGESLRSLDVEIGSADGHEDGGERQVNADRITGDSQAARTRRANMPLGHFSPVVGRDTPLHSVAEVSENSSRDADQADQASPVAEQQVNSDAGSGAIDPAFLDALPEELRAEVLSAQQGQVAQPPNAESQNSGDIDPEFLAALPADIRAEVLAQQQAQRSNQSQELEGQPIEMDTVSIIATFPSDLREEVLLTSSDNILANLTPALVAEANMLRERYAHRYSRTLFGMYPRSRRGETSRRGDGIGSGLDAVGGPISSRRSSGAKVVEADGAPLVDTEALHGMVRLFRMVQPIYKGQLQRLLLNLCAHSETRISLVKILMDLLMLDVRRSAGSFSTVEPPYRLYGCQSNVMYSRPQSYDGVPPLLSRRVLETLTYLARNHLYVAKNLLQSRLSHPEIREPNNASDARGKAVMVVEDEVNIDESNGGYISIAMLLGLLNQPLYLRSIAHLEQLLNLLDVIIDSAGSKSSPSDKSLISASKPASGPQISAVEPEANTASGILTSIADASTAVGDSSKPTPVDNNMESESQRVLSSLPQSELRLLCSLLAHEGLSDNAYTLVAEVVKKLVAIAPTHCQLFVTQLAEAVQNLTSSAMAELRVFSEAMKALLSTTSTDGAAILRVLQALSSLVTSLTEDHGDSSTPAALSEFVGRVVGKALFDGQLLDVHFTRSFYKHILGVKVTYHDIEAIDPDYFKNLKWMLEHDISDVLDLTFSIDADEEKLILYERTEVTDYELIPGGRNIKVTEENKHQYVDLVAEHRLTTAIRPQINAFLEGFSELIPRELISIFNDKELELLISGLPDIDLDDLRANTEYSGYSAASPVIQWFWEVVQDLSKEDKARLLQFVTGTSKVPLEGFSALQGISGSQKFQIHKAYGSPDHLPSAHTCFNQLDLPEYPSKQHLEDRLLLAIHEASEGFGFG